VEIAASMTVRERTLRARSQNQRRLGAFAPTVIPTIRTCRIGRILAQRSRNMFSTMTASVNDRIARSAWL
jgi:hypothetical protein